ncbi:unnamed protein product [Adineta ricciae]|uniref:LCCL domain-containing protein n=1 Tax=Adineta ricciae TaxID=249248 RepID=A0A815NWY5_ADIRI|nr:unnamed protein product [Adineta ricciae]
MYSILHVAIKLLLCIAIYPSNNVAAATTQVTMLETNPYEYGQNITYLVTGVLGKCIWGTNIYTDDSNLSMAAVHAGILRVGETKNITIQILPGQTYYQGSTQNGVTSSSFDSWTGSYSFYTSSPCTYCTTPTMSATPAAAINSTNTSYTTLTPDTTMYTTNSSRTTSTSVTLTNYPNASLIATLPATAPNSTNTSYAPLTLPTATNSQNASYSTSTTNSQTISTSDIAAHSTTVLSIITTSSSAQVTAIASTTVQTSSVGNHSNSNFTVTTLPISSTNSTAISKPTVTSSALESSTVATTLGTSVNLVNYRDKVGQNLFFTITGAVGGSIWGTNIYTDDSNLATAAVHAGILRVGQTSTIIVKILPGQSSYTASNRNGVNSFSYGSWIGSYSFVSVASTTSTNVASTTTTPSPTTVSTTTSTTTVKSSSVGSSTTHVVLASTANLVNYRDKVGQNLFFTITGAVGGSIWGTNIYTDDSNLATAAVHAGILRVGQTSTIIVKILPGQSSYTASNRNGVNSFSYGSWIGSYSFFGVAR